MRIGVLGRGAMGKALCSLIEEREQTALAGCIEPLVGERLESLDRADVVVDFSHPDNLGRLREFCAEMSCAAVIATTGYSREQIEEIYHLGEVVPVVFSANYSRGLNAMRRAVNQITPALKDGFDIEIIEKHHRKKLDSPSGTAIMLVESINEKNEYEKIFGRYGNRRRGREIGIHSIRGGTIAGEHTIIYAGEDEVLEITHRASSKNVFAQGALKAAEFAAKAPVGFYTMDDV